MKFLSSWATGSILLSFSRTTTVVDAFLLITRNHPNHNIFGCCSSVTSSSSSSSFHTQTSQRPWIQNSILSSLTVRGGSSDRSFLSATATTTKSSTSETQSSEAADSTVGTTTAAADASITNSSAMNELKSKLEAITHLRRAQAVVTYDQMVFMPSRAAAERGHQLAALASVIHSQTTDPQLLELIQQSSALLTDKESSSSRLVDDDRRLLQLEEKAFLQNQRIPPSLASKAAALSATAYQDWVTAKEKADFAAFVPTLQECFDTAMAMAKAKMGNNNNTNNNNNQKEETACLYDQMLDEYEVGMSKQRIDDMFDQVQQALVPLIARVLDGQDTQSPSSKPLEGTFDVHKQQQLSETLVTAMGFDPDMGRIDVSVHPFTMSMSVKDVRITSRFRTDEWYQGLAGSIHEAGHAMYEQNLNPTALSLDTPLSMGTHESQSLFWERHIGLSRPFWRFAHPHLTQILDQSFFQQYTPEDVYKAVNRVSRSLIRVEADELTYPLHVILRYNIEKDVIAGKLHVKDIATRWNQDMKLLLNIDVPTDDKGALQDVHWSGLAFGYFPTYLIGAIAAAQLYHYCAMDIPDIERKIESGDFVPIKDWLKEKVHRHGRRYPSLDAMLEEQLGEALNPKYFIDYLTTKYSELYQILVTITVQRKLTILRPKARSIHKGQPSTIKYLEDAVVGHAIEMRQLREAIDRAKEWLLETRPILSAPNVFKEYTINMDQAPLPFSLASSTTLELEGEKTVTIRQTENSKTRCTVSLTITADGRKLKPMIIFKSQRGAGRLRPENLQPASIETTWCSAVNTMPGKTRKT